MTMMISVLMAAALATQSFREEHARVKAHLDHAAQLTPAEALKFFETEIVPHAEGEEEKLYPLIDSLAGTTEKNRYTATMRHEHRIVGRWIGLLRENLRKGDKAAFAARVQNLVGLVQAHFEEEEEVLLPWADRTMSAAEFQAAMGGAHAGHH